MNRRNAIVNRRQPASPATHTDLRDERSASRKPNSTADAAVIMGCSTNASSRHAATPAMRRRSNKENAHSSSGVESERAVR